MKIFQTEIMLCATAYIQAETAEDASRIMDSWHFRGVEFNSDQWVEDGMVISGARFDSDDFPDLSLSPAMTLYIQTPDGSRLLAAAYDEVS